MPFWKRESTGEPKPAGFEQLIPAGALRHPRLLGLGAILCAGGILYMGFSSDKQPQPAPPPTSAVTPGDQPVQPQSIEALKKSTDDEYAQLHALKEQMKHIHDAVGSSGSDQEPPQNLADIQRQNADALQDARRERLKFAEQNNGTTTQGQSQAGTSDRTSSSIVFDDRKQVAAGAPATQEPTKDQSPEAKAPPQTVASTPVRKGLDFDPSLFTHTLPEGTVLELVLTNRLEGSSPDAPVNAMVTTPVYALGTRTCLLPQGALFLGRTVAVNTFGQDRLAVGFHRIRCGTGKHLYTIPLGAKMSGLDQAGASGLKDKTNFHYLSTFGAALGIGAVTGLANIGNFSAGANGYNSTGQFQTGISQSVAESSQRVLEKYVNRLPTITIQEGERVKIILTDDVKAPAYPEPVKSVYDYLNDEMRDVPRL